MKRKTLIERLQDQKTQKAITNWKKSNYDSRTRLKKRVNEIINKQYAYFITFTIAPEHYGLKKMTYIRKAKEALLHASQWVANEDFGEQFGRYHIHALACFLDKFDYTIDENTLEYVWRYGIIHFKPIHTPNDDAVSNYMNKLSNHATKETAHRIMYSKVKAHD